MIETAETMPVRYSRSEVCRLMKIARTTMYYRLKHPKQLQYTEEEAKKVKDMFFEHNESFGRRTLKRELEKINVILSERKISRIMKDYDLKSKYGRKKGKNVHTHKKTSEKYIAENKYWMSAENERPKNAWSMDFTEQKAAGKTVYTCAIISVNKKNLTGRITGEPNSAETACKTLDKAIKKFGVPDMILTDRGSPFTSKSFHEMIEEYHIEHSMSRPHTPRDNRYIETFWRTMKTEIGPTNNMTDAEYKMVMDYYEYYYNYLRPHSVLGYRPPLSAD